jgi:hypothetical protein
MWVVSCTYCFYSASLHIWTVYSYTVLCYLSYCQSKWLIFSWNAFHGESYKWSAFEHLSLQYEERSITAFTAFSWPVSRNVNHPVAIKARNTRFRQTNMIRCVRLLAVNFNEKSQPVSVCKRYDVRSELNWLSWLKQTPEPIDTQIQTKTLPSLLSTSSHGSTFIEFVWPKVVGSMAGRHSNAARRPVFSYSDASIRQHATKDESHKTFPSALFSSLMAPSPFP